MATGLLAGLGLLLGLGVARAASEGGEGAHVDEDALIREALMMRRRGNDRAAQVELQRAYDLGHSPRAAAQLGFAEQALGMWPQAETHVGAALRAPDDPWIRRNQATLEQSLVVIRAHVGRVEIVGGAPGAQVTINGEPVGLLPLADAVAVSAGPVDIEVRTPGAPLATKTVNVAVGEYARVPFPVPASAAVVAPAPPRPPSLAPVQPVGGNAPTAPSLLRTDRPDEGHGRRVAGIGLVAGGLAAVGGGVAASLAGRHKFDAINADAAAGRPYDERNGNWKTYETAATALYVVGAGALIGGTVLYVSGRARGARGEESAAHPPAAPPVSVSLKPQVAPGRAGAAIAVRF